MLWTDGRYFLQASQELDDNWELMKDYQPGTPSIQQALAEVRFLIDTCGEISGS